jgi:hypothetical protein
VKPETLSAYVAVVGTRCLVTIGAGVVDTILCWFNKITGEQYVTLTLGTVGVFIAAAAYQKAQEAKAYANSP